MKNNEREIISGTWALAVSSGKNRNVKDTNYPKKNTTRDASAPTPGVLVIHGSNRWVPVELPGYRRYTADLHGTFGTVSFPTTEHTPFRSVVLPVQGRYTSAPFSARRL